MYIRLMSFAKQNERGHITSKVQEYFKLQNKINLHCDFELSTTPCLHVCNGTVAATTTILLPRKLGYHNFCDPSRGAMKHLWSSWRFLNTYTTYRSYAVIVIFAVAHVRESLRPKHSKQNQPQKTVFFNPLLHASWRQWQSRNYLTMVPIFNVPPSRIVWIGSNADEKSNKHNNEQDKEAKQKQKQPKPTTTKQKTNKGQQTISHSQKEVKQGKTARLSNVQPSK